MNFCDSPENGILICVLFNFSIVLIKIDEIIRDNLTSIIHGYNKHDFPFNLLPYNYVGASCNYDSIVSLNVLDKLITNLPTKKSPGFDLLSAEHLKYSHPIILKIIRLLISLMVSNRYVPSAFSCGITVPLPKATYKRSQTSVNDYRGITIILPIISKLLKFTQLKCLITFLGTSAAQFGFKKGHSCTHAIFSARKLLIILPHKTPLLIFAHWTSVRLLTVSAILICLTNFWTEIYLLILSVF